ncbi:coiled-coil domain-containing protein 92-like [Antedon mediterranea]|uniref:coiled-coil domain-containing protein 92-like n=1 Tax=Antedon mediterranea TaxID=105859 RepID=UPI003AF78E91
MATPLDIQLQNAKTSILFMQQEHANTLQSLHQEIQKLQKKCAEMTFELAIKGDVDEEAYQEESQRLDKHLREKTIECNNMQEILDKREKRISVLELQLRAQEKRYTDEIKQKNLKMNTIKNDLDEKNRIIAMLSNEIQKLSLGSSYDDTERSNSVTPVPPKSSIPSSRRKVSIKKRLVPHLGDANHQRPIKAVHFNENADPTSANHRASSGYRSPALIKDSQTPSIRAIHPESTDSKVFVLRQKERNREVVVRRRLPILPPIVNQEDHTSIIDSTNQSDVLHQEVPVLRLDKRETLAVNSLFLQDNLREVEHSNSD